MNKFQVFQPKFNNEEMELEFQDFFYIHKLTALMTNEHRHPSGISVTWVDARSVLSDGSYAKTLIAFSKYLEQATDNKSYEEALFKVLYNARTFQKLISNIKQVMFHIENNILDKYLHNMWNIVWYAKGVLT